MLAEHLGRKAHGLVGPQRPVGKYIQCQLIVIGNLPHAGILYRNIYSLSRRVYRIDCNHTNR